LVHRERIDERIFGILIGPIFEGRSYVKGQNSTVNLLLYIELRAERQLGHY
jgi:hypothetical protein